MDGEEWEREGKGKKNNEMRESQRRERRRG